MKMQMSIVNKEERKAAEKYFQRTKVDRQAMKFFCHSLVLLFLLFVLLLLLLLLHVIFIEFTSETADHQTVVCLPEQTSHIHFHS